MRSIRTAIALAASLLTLGLGTDVRADQMETPMFLPATGHYYALVGPFTFDPPIGPGYPAISWDTANADAATRSFQGEVGHLATVTSFAENAFIESKIAARPDCYTPELTAGSFRFKLGPWIGGMRADANADFEWVNGEGVFADATGMSINGSFVDFVDPPEPNGQNFVNYIDFLARPPNAPDVGWSDCLNANCFDRRSPVCYVIEFDTPRPPPPSGCGRD